MRCDDGCISRDGSNTTSTSRITVDGNTNGAVLAPVECLDGLASEGGNNCTIVLNVPVSFIFLFVQSYPYGYVTSTL